MDVILLGMAMFSNFSQSLKALSEIVVMLLGRVTDCKARQLLKADLPMVVTLSGRVILTKLSHA